MSYSPKLPERRYIDSPPAISSYERLANEAAVLYDPGFTPTAEDLALLSLVYGRNDSLKFLKEVLYSL